MKKRNPEDGNEKEKPYKSLGTDDFGLKRKRKMLTMSELSPSCLEEIRHSVLVKHLTYEQAAALHMVKPTLVQSLMTRMKKDPEFISKKVQKMEDKQQAKEKVETYVNSQLECRQPIDSALQVTEVVNDMHGTNLKAYMTRNILKYHLGLKYKQLQYGAPEANTQRCLVLRQQAAIKLLLLMSEGKRIYNVDESWIDQLNFTRGHWHSKFYPKKGQKAVSPRISLIACVGSDGSAYYCLTQVNTDANVFCLYLTELVKKLTQDDKNWRDNSVLLLDNAAYHLDEKVLKHLAFLNVTVIFSGPCKYQSSA